MSIKGRPRKGLSVEDLRGAVETLAIDLTKDLEASASVTKLMTHLKLGNTKKSKRLFFRRVEELLKNRSINSSGDNAELLVDKCDIKCDRSQNEISTGGNAEKKDNCGEDCVRSQSEDGADTLGITTERNLDLVNEDHSSVQPDHGKEDKPLNEGSQRATDNSGASCESDSEEEEQDIWLRYMGGWKNGELEAMTDDELINIVGFTPTEDLERLQKLPRNLQVAGQEFLRRERERLREMLLPRRSCSNRYMVQAEVKKECDVSSSKNVENKSDPVISEKQCSSDYEIKDNKCVSDLQRSDSDPMLSKSKCVKRPQKSEVECDSTKYQPSGVCKQPRVVHGKKSAPGVSKKKESKCKGKEFLCNRQKVRKVMKKKEKDKLKEGSETVNEPCTSSKGASDSEPECSDYMDVDKEWKSDREREIYEYTSDVESLVKASEEKKRKASKVQSAAEDVEVKSVSAPRKAGCKCPADPASKYKLFRGHVRIPRKDWKKVWNGQSFHKRYYGSTINTAFNSLKLYCPLNMKKWRPLKRTSRNEHGHEFDAVVYAECVHPNCRKFKFCINSRTRKMCVYSCPCKMEHKEARSRLLNGPEREKVRRVLKRMKPRNYFKERVNRVNKKFVRQGNYLGIPSIDTLKKIRQDYHGRVNLAEDPVVDLMIMRRIQVLLKKDVYIMKVTDPLGCIIFSKERYEMYQKAVAIAKKAKKCVVLHLDSTGSVVKKAVKGDKAIYFYALVYKLNVDERLKKQEKIIAPLTELVSSEHGVAAISNWLLDFRRYYNDIGNKQFTPKHVVTDCSLALLHGVSMAFNEFSLDSYLLLCHRLATSSNNKKKSVRNKILCFLHLCYSHFMKNVGVKVNGAYKTFMNKDGASKQSSSAAEFKKIKTLIMKTITLIFHCASYSEIKVIFEAFFTILTNKYSHPSVTKAMKLLDEKFEEDAAMFSDLTDEMLNDEDSEDSGALQAEDLVISKVKYENNKFYMDMSKLYEEIKDKSDSVDFSLMAKDTIKVENNFYNRGFADFVLKYWVRLLPLWSGLFTPPGVRRFSNDPAENFFEQTKIVILDKMGPFRVNQFVRKENKWVKHLHKRVDLRIRSRRMVRGNVGDTSGKVSKRKGEATSPDQIKNAKRKKVEVELPSDIEVENSDAADEPDIVDVPLPDDREQEKDVEGSEGAEKVSEGNAPKAKNDEDYEAETIEISDGEGDDRRALEEYDEFWSKKGRVKPPSWKGPVTGEAVKAALKSRVSLRQSLEAIETTKIPSTPKIKTLSSFEAHIEERLLANGAIDDIYYNRAREVLYTNSMQKNDLLMLPVVMYQSATIGNESLGNLPWMSFRTLLETGRNKYLTGAVIDAAIEMIIKAQGFRSKVKYLECHRILQVMSGEWKNFRRLRSPINLDESAEWIISILNLNGNHWVALFVNIKDYYYHYLNPFKGQNETEINFSEFPQYLDFISGKSKLKNGTKYVEQKWKCCEIEDRPYQNDGYNCGVFCIHYTDVFLRKLRGLEDTQQKKLSKRIKQSKIVTSLMMKNEFLPDEYRRVVQWFLIRRSEYLNDHCLTCAEVFKSRGGKIWVECKCCKRWAMLEEDCVRVPDFKNLKENIETVNFTCRTCLDDEKAFNKADREQKLKEVKDLIRYFEFEVYS